MDKLIRQAIAEKKIVEFQYKRYSRIGEPHIYGQYRGVNQLLIYQVRGGSNSGGLPEWRRVDLSQVSDFKVLNENFPGPRQNSSGQHSGWDQIFAFVS